MSVNINIAYAFLCINIHEVLGSDRLWLKGDTKRLHMHSKLIWDLEKGVRGFQSDMHMSTAECTTEWIAQKPIISFNNQNAAVGREKTDKACGISSELVLLSGGV